MVIKKAAPKKKGPQIKKFSNKTQIQNEINKIKLSKTLSVAEKNILISRLLKQI